MRVCVCVHWVYLRVAKQVSEFALPWRIYGRLWIRCGSSAYINTISLSSVLVKCRLAHHCSEDYNVRGSNLVSRCVVCFWM